MATLIQLDNGQSIQTTDNSPADIAGLVNAGEQHIYTCSDRFSPTVQHHIVVAHIVDVTETP